MKIKTLPWDVINRSWERIVADKDWFIETENKEVIEVLTKLFKIEEIAPKQEIWKSKVKKYKIVKILMGLEQMF